MPPLSFKISLNIHTVIFLLSFLRLYLSPECLLIFSNLYIPPCVEKNQIYGDHIPRECIESRHFYSCLTSPLKTPRKMFWKPVSPNSRKGWRKLWLTCFIKIQSENMKKTWNIRSFIFCMVCNFSKFDGFTIF